MSQSRHARGRQAHGFLPVHLAQNAFRRDHRGVLKRYRGPPDQAAAGNENKRAFGPKRPGETNQLAVLDKMAPQYFAAFQRPRKRTGGERRIGGR
jgi:hypothetical protein